MQQVALFHNLACYIGRTSLFLELLAATVAATLQLLHLSLTWLNLLMALQVQKWSPSEMTDGVHAEESGNSPSETFPCISKPFIAFALLNDVPHHSPPITCRWQVC